MIQLRAGTIGTAKAGCHVLEMTGAIGTPQETAARLSELVDQMQESGEYWGGENNAVVVVVDKDSEPWAAATAIATVSTHDECPIAALLIAGENNPRAVCVYAGESGMDIGEDMAYEAGDVWTPAADADPAKTSEARG